jgi:hypothetical protein
MTTGSARKNYTYYSEKVDEYSTTPIVCLKDNHRVNEAHLC